jgi:hypothetical protein
LILAAPSFDLRVGLSTPLLLSTRGPPLYS